MANTTSKILVWHFTALQKQSVGGVEAVLRFLSQAMEKLDISVGFGTKLPPDLTQDNSQIGKIFVHCHGSPMPWLSFIWMRFILPLYALKPITWIYVAHGTSLGRAIACAELLRPGTWRAVVREFLICNFSHGCIAVSERAAEEVRKYYRIKPIPIAVIPNGVEVAIFKRPSAIGEGTSKENAKPRVAFVGRHGDVVKNFSALLEAMALAKQQISDLELIAVPGDVSLPQDQVFSTGPLYGNDLAKELYKCSLLILPSLYEGDPLVLREAMAMGLSIVASDIPSISLTTKSYEKKELIPVGDISGLAKAIVSQIKLVTNPTTNATTNANYTPRSWDEVAKEYRDFYIKYL